MKRKSTSYQSKHNNELHILSIYCTSLFCRSYLYTYKCNHNLLKRKNNHSANFTQPKTTLSNLMPKTKDKKTKTTHKLKQCRHLEHAVLQHTERRSKASNKATMQLAILMFATKETAPEKVPCPSDEAVVRITTIHLCLEPTAAPEQLEFLINFAYSVFVQLVIDSVELTLGGQAGNITPSVVVAASMSHLSRSFSKLANLGSVPGMQLQSWPASFLSQGLSFKPSAILSARQAAFSFSVKFTSFSDCL